MGLGSNLEVALQESAFEAEGPTIPCRVSSVVWHDAQLRFQRYSNLVYLLALHSRRSSSPLCSSSSRTTRGAKGSSHLSAALISGGLAAFIKGERDQARKDRDAAQKIVGKQCAGQTAEQVVASMGI